MSRTVHIIGAGLAGLAAAIRLANSGARIVVHEATGQPGGRCRSYYDKATDLRIDNGNHLVLSGNHAAVAYMRTLGTEDRMHGPATPDFPFIDMATAKRWTLRISEGRMPWWIFDPSRRVPNTRVIDYLKLGRLALAPGKGSLADVVDCSGPLYDQLLQPLLLAALNVEPPTGSAALASAIIRETMLAGGHACRPLIARTGLGDVFVDPAVDYLRARGIDVLLRHELRAIGFDNGRAVSLGFGEETVELGADDKVIVTVPPYAASVLLPDLRTPTVYRPIVNAHFRMPPPAGFPPMLGVLNATSEWIFGFGDRLSVTVSAGDRLLDIPREALAESIWQEVARATGLNSPLPPWQIVRERRATFGATPEEDAKRPTARTRWHNIFLAGDWTATGLPATIEGAIRSGNHAADLVD